MNALVKITEILKIDSNLKKLIFKEVAIPYLDDYNQVNESWYPHPPCLIPLFLGYGASYKGIVNHFFVDRSNTFVEYFLEHGYFSEVARTSEQLITRMILQMITAKDEVTEDINDFCNNLNFTELNKVDDFSITYGDNPNDFEKLVHFSNKTPLRYISDSSKYDGDFPSSHKTLNATQVNNACAFEISTTANIKELKKIPLWLQESNNKKELFENYIANNQLKEAWLTLNSKGWLLTDVAKGLEMLKTKTNDELFHLVANNWLQRWEKSTFKNSNY
jgi:hypothetical protein